MNVKRILNEIRNFNNDKSIKNAFILPDENNVRHIDVLIIGNKDTPYECGYFWFTFNFPELYPSSPPKVQFKTTNSAQIRFNPNLYKCGKVCLSVINTWGSNDWSPANSLSSIILSIQSLVLHDKPLVNEPGHEKQSKTNIEIYNRIKKIETMHMALLFLNNKTGAPIEFVNIARQNFNKERMLELCLKEDMTVVQLQDLISRDSIEINFSKLVDVVLDINIEKDIESNKDILDEVLDSKIDNDYKTCDICLKESDFVSKSCCSFKSCTECLDKWLTMNNNCPQCKKILKTTVSNYIISGNSNNVMKAQCFLNKQKDLPKLFKIQGKTYTEICELIKAAELPNASLEDKMFIVCNNLIFNVNTNQWVSIIGPTGKKIIKKLNITIEPNTNELLKTTVKCFKNGQYEIVKYNKIQGKTDQQIYDLIQETKLPNASQEVKNMLLSKDKVFNLQTNKWISANGLIGKKIITESNINIDSLKIKNTLEAYVKIQKDSQKLSKLQGKSYKDMYNILKTDKTLLKYESKVFNIETKKWVSEKGKLGSSIMKPTGQVIQLITLK